MSVSTEVQRTLVKSPPELWAELSNPEALARHLSELGEIRITGTEPETKVEWETDGATGIVRLKQSGWGTKVTLSVTRLQPATDDAHESAEEPERAPAPEHAPEPVAEVEPDPDPEPVAEVEPGPEPIAEVEPEPEPAQARAPELRQGFFARLFRRRARANSQAVDAEIEPRPAPVEREPIAVVEPAPEPDFEALAAPDLIFEPTPQPAVDLAAELASVEAQMAQETTELLTGVLDRLGAAHHRPFSRG